MKYLMCISFITSLFIANSQSILDSCFSTVDFGYTLDLNHGVYHPESEYISGSGFDLAIWNGENWEFDRKNVNKRWKNRPWGPYGKGERAFLVGGIATTSRTVKIEEFIAFRLNEKLEGNQKYRFNFTYVSTYHIIYPNESYDVEFSPKVLTNRKPKLKGASYHGNLKAVGNSWETNSFDFEVTKECKGHEWLLLDVTDISFKGQQGMILNFCVEINEDSALVVAESLDQLKSDSIIIKQEGLDLEGLEKGDNLVLDNILFESGKSILLPESKPSLDRLFQALLASKALHVEIIGHTDNQGAEEFNQKLSEARAEVVKGFLLEKGIDSSRLKASGRGSTNPLTSNKTEEGRRKNRRVELLVLED